MTAPRVNRSTLLKIQIGIISALLLLYIVMTFRQSMMMMFSGEPVNTAMGIALFLLPTMGFALVVREILFGAQAERLLRRMEEEDELPEDDLPRLPSGRVERQAADADFPRWKHDAERSPEDWRTWFRLALAYDASGDRRRARAAVRKAVTLERDARRGAQP